MTTLTVTTRGQITLCKAVLKHLDTKPGERIELDLLPGGRAMLKTARPDGSMADFVGRLAGRTANVAAIDEINEASAVGWVGRE